MRYELRVDLLLCRVNVSWPPLLEDRVAGHLGTATRKFIGHGLLLAKQTAEESTTLGFSQLIQLTGV
jgi:hypothetical protein